MDSRSPGVCNRIASSSQAAYGRPFLCYFWIMDNCKLCERPRMPRKDRPGKFRTLCSVHYNEYMAQKNREYYARNQAAQQQRARDWRTNNPESYKASYQRYNSKPEVRERVRKYMQVYNSPYRAFVKDACELCGYETRDPTLRRDLDVHHLDGNHENNDSSNLQTLCPPCHRLL